MKLLYKSHAKTIQISGNCALSAKWVRGLENYGFRIRKVKMDAMAPNLLTLFFPHKHDRQQVSKIMNQHGNGRVVVCTDDLELAGQYRFVIPVKEEEELAPEEMARLIFSKLHQQEKLRERSLLKLFQRFKSPITTAIQVNRGVFYPKRKESIV